MDTMERLARHQVTERERTFEANFLKDVDSIETWDGVEIGKSFTGKLKFTVKEEDVLHYNQAMGIAMHARRGGVIENNLISLSWQSRRRGSGLNSVGPIIGTARAEPSRICGCCQPEHHHDESNPAIAESLVDHNPGRPHN